jgi:hypothetical protein
MVYDDVGHVLQQQDRAIILHFEHGVGEGLRADPLGIVDVGQDVSDRDSLIRRLDPPARAHVVSVGARVQPRFQGIGRGLQEVLDRDLVPLHALRIRLNL